MSKMAVNLNELPPCTHGPHEAKAVFVGTGRCALCLTDQIESLQRENEELRAAYKLQGDYKLLYETGLDEVVKSLSRPAIAPEMRKKIERTLEAMDAMGVQVRALTPLEQTSRRHFRDLLGEQG